MRAARALLRWAAADLVRESGVSLATIHRAESVDGKTAMTFANASAIRRALENAGVELIEENGGGPGARLSSIYRINQSGRQQVHETASEPDLPTAINEKTFARYHRAAGQGPILAKRTQKCLPYFRSPLSLDLLK